MSAVIRDGVPHDAPAVAAIYDREALTGWATFATQAGGPEPWRARIEGPEPFLVAEEHGEIVAMAYADEFRTRAAYHLTRETSLYLAPQARGQGLGTRMYAELLARLRAAGRHTALAVIAQPNEASVRLHLSAGFTEVGTLREVGDKLGRMIDVRLYQLML